jgi:hypothetical protein
MAGKKVLVVDDVFGMVSQSSMLSGGRCHEQEHSASMALAVCADLDLLLNPLETGGPKIRNL